MDLPQMKRRLAASLKLLIDILSMRDEQDENTVFRPGVHNSVFANPEPGKAGEFTFQLLTGVRVLLELSFKLIEYPFRLTLIEVLEVSCYRLLIVDAICQGIPSARHWK